MQRASQPSTSTPIRQYKTSNRKYTQKLRSPLQDKSVCPFSFIQFPYPSIVSLVKSGYPPRTLTIVPELPLHSLGLQLGDQIIVSEAPNPDTQIPLSRTTHPPLPVPIQPPQSPSGPDHVEVDASFLIHRVNRGLRYLFLVITHSKR